MYYEGVFWLMNQFVLYWFKLLCYFFVCLFLFSVTAFEIMPLSLLLDIGLCHNEQYFVKQQSYQKYSVAFIHRIAETEALRDISVLAQFVCFPLSHA